MIDIRHLISMQATADVFKEMNAEGSSNNVIEYYKNMPDDFLNIAGRHAGIQKEHLSIYRQLVRGENNEFLDKLKGFEHQLQPGDLILVTGTSTSSKTLVKLQKSIYQKARSSHIAVIQAEFICIDAMPEIGVSLRLISEIIKNVEDNWRVIRLKSLKETEFERLNQTCIYYLEQPYAILPLAKPAKKFSYCSELARKVYINSEIKECGIPKNNIIKPCDFDKIADESSKWQDITESVRGFINFCIEYEDILNFISKIYINGVKLNRQRFDERKKTKNNIKKMVKKGIVKSETAAIINNKTDELESLLNYKFWDK